MFMRGWYGAGYRNDAKRSRNNDRRKWCEFIRRLKSAIKYRIGFLPKLLDSFAG